MNFDIDYLNQKFDERLPLILASASPRRRGLLQKLGLKFKVMPSYLEERNISSGTPGEKARIWAFLKAEAIAKQHQGVIIGADTIVVLEGEILGKPHNETEAKKMLRRLSGNTHTVITALAVINTRSDSRIVTSVESQVSFRKLNQEEINSYIATKEPMDKAGAYGIQGGAARFVTQVQGCYTNVVGLPISSCLESLKQIVRADLTSKGN